MKDIGTLTVVTTLNISYNLLAFDNSSHEN